MSSTNQNALWPELTAILLARLSVLWLLVLISLAFPHSDAAFHAFMGVAFIITIPYSLWLRNRLRSTQFAPLQFLADMVLVTGIVYFTGGVNSNLTLLYPLVILSAGIVATPKQAAEITILGIVIYLLMVFMLSQNILVEYLPEGKETKVQSMYPEILLRVLAFALFGATSIYVSKRCNYFNKHDKDTWITAETLLHKLDASILMLDCQGKILSASPTACKLLNSTEKELSTRKLSELCISGPHPIPEYYGQSAYFARPDAPPIPISCRSTDVKLPATAIPGHTGKGEESIKVTLVVFSDLSRAMELEHQLTQVEQIAAATRIAGEMANEIRTPLTTISASIQLLQHFEEKATAEDWLPDSPRKKDRLELFEHITNASKRMDAVVQNFVDFADFSPPDLLSIIKLDSNGKKKGYIGHLSTLIKGFENGQDSNSGRRPNDIELIE
ncbi:MAG: histidine kinase dimerization/phospho-acceptor domain-containing protein [Verrucomicrobiota bacterium]